MRLQESSRSEFQSLQKASAKVFGHHAELVIERFVFIIDAVVRLLRREKISSKGGPSLSHTDGTLIGIRLFK